jgi:hypothetical protein
MAVNDNWEKVYSSNGLGGKTQIVTMSKSTITNAEMLAAIRAAEAEGNTVAGTIKATNVLTLALQGAGITAGSNYGASGVTSAVVATFED